MLDIVLPAVFAVGDLRQQFAAENVAAFVENGLEAGLDRIAAEALEQFGHAARAHQAGLHLAVEIGRQHFGHAGIALDDGEDGVVADARAVELDRRHGEAFLEHRRGGARHRARHAAADIVVMAESLDVGDDLAVVKNRNGAAQIGQVADRALGEIGVVHQEDVARLHGLGRKVAHHRVRHRRIGAPGQLAAIAVEQPDAVIVRFADHRRARGALDGVFDFRFDRIERALDDLQHDRIDFARAAIAAPSATARFAAARSSARLAGFAALPLHDQNTALVDFEPLAREIPPSSSRIPPPRPVRRAESRPATRTGHRSAYREMRRRNRPAACVRAAWRRLPWRVWESPDARSCRSRRRRN